VPTGTAVPCVLGHCNCCNCNCCTFRLQYISTYLTILPSLAASSFRLGQTPTATAPFQCSTGLQAFTSGSTADCTPNTYRWTNPYATRAGLENESRGLMRTNGREECVHGMGWL
jgi:hypothetical protein